jgi:hypothetical protein
MSMPDEQPKRNYYAAYRITSLESFREVTEEPRQTAGLYFYQLTDCLIELAYQVSADFRARPQLYRRLGERTPAALARLNAKYGTDVDFLSTDQRNAIYLPVFGSWDGPPTGNDSFGPLRDSLIAAAKAFAERASDTGIGTLRASFVTAHRPFKDYLVALHGDSVRFSKDVALAELTEKNAYPILRDLGVAAVFGVTRTHPPTEYPYATDPEEDVLVEQISTSLSGDGVMRYTRERISNLQRAALRGAEAIAAAVDFEEAREEVADGRLDALITRFYTWGTALDTLSSATTVPPQSRPQAAASAQSPTSTKAPVT